MSEIALEFKPVDTEPTKAVAEAVTTTLKRAYTMSDLKKEQLVKARARAVELRNALNAIKPPNVKPVKIKQPSKLEIEISEIQASKPIEPEQPKPTEQPEQPVTQPEPVPPAEPKLVKEKKQKEAPIKQQRKPPSLMVSTPPPPPLPPTPPPTGFKRNSFGFYVL
jgi:hypothetical protein